MKRIDGSDVRKGDTIRREYAHSFDNRRAIEFVIESDGVCIGNGDALYLIHRPTPAVVLPTEATLGILTFSDGVKRVGEVRAQNSRQTWLSGRWSSDWGEVTAFTLATVVPTDALNELQRRAKVGQFACLLGQPVLTFLAAVDAANGDA